MPRACDHQRVEPGERGVWAVGGSEGSLPVADTRRWTKNTRKPKKSGGEIDSLESREGEMIVVSEWEEQDAA